MSHLRTDWLCVATEGDTVDKRKLERQWLIDAAETYDPKLYGALIWPEHDKDFGNFGEVLCAMWQEGNDGLVRLYVQLRPNAYLLAANSRDQLIYFSVELTEDGNWRGTGRSYLEGLAVTDTPASVGTTRLRFNKRRKSNPGYYACRVSRKGIEQDNEMKKPNWQSYFGIKPKHFEEITEELKGDAPDQLQILADALNDLESRVSSIETQLADTQEDMETVKEVVDTEDFAVLRDNVSAIVKNFSKLDKKVTTLPRRSFSDKKNEPAKGFKFL